MSAPTPDIKDPKKCKKDGKKDKAEPETPEEIEKALMNRERAFIAASRRGDRTIEARMESANRASEVHYQRTGKYLRITREDVENETMYEEEDPDHGQKRRRMDDLMYTSNALDGQLPHYMTRNFTPMQQTAGSISQRMAAVSSGYNQFLGNGPDSLSSAASRGRSNSIPNPQGFQAEQIPRGIPENRRLRQRLASDPYIFPQTPRQGQGPMERGSGAPPEYLSQSAHERFARMQQLHYSGLMPGFPYPNQQHMGLPRNQAQQVQQQYIPEYMYTPSQQSLDMQATAFPQQGQLSQQRAIQRPALYTQQSLPNICQPAPRHILPQHSVSKWDMNLRSPITMSSQSSSTIATKNATPVGWPTTPHCGSPTGEGSLPRLMMSNDFPPRTNNKRKLLENANDEENGIPDRTQSGRNVTNFPTSIMLTNTSNAHSKRPRNDCGENKALEIATGGQTILPSGSHSPEMSSADPSPISRNSSRATTASSKSSPVDPPTKTPDLPKTDQGLDSTCSDLASGGLNDDDLLASDRAASEFSFFEDAFPVASDLEERSFDPQYYDSEFPSNPPFDEAQFLASLPEIVA
ncbi:hypothetical protein FQN50_000766 [Emmonsiellopsis sp. PD_5]|nr:hypothetical protein FQN50_000766 [Emmonsiellopsis sp. PD_5]